MKTTIGDYLLMRLTELGIGHVFGVPGDYDLGFLDLMVNKLNLDIVKYLVENGAYVNAVGRLNATPLNAAEQKNHWEIETYLRAHGAN